MQKIIKERKLTINIRITKKTKKNREEIGKLLPEIGHSEEIGNASEEQNNLKRKSAIQKKKKIMPYYRKRGENIKKVENER